jgi:hypothetical protein
MLEKFLMRHAAVMLCAASMLTGCFDSGGGDEETLQATANQVPSQPAQPAPSAPAPDESSEPAPPANDPPSISGVPAPSVQVGQAYSFAPVASDADNNTLMFTVANAPAWAQFNAQTGALTGTPTAAHVGTTNDITITVSDGTDTSSVGPFAITVNQNAPPASNAAPTISGTPATSINAGQTYSFQPSAADANGDTLRFTIANRPSWATFNTTTGRLSGTAGAAQAGNSYANIVISVNDGNLSAALPAFTIAVPNRAPTISGTPATSVTAGSAYSFQPTAADADGQSLGYTIQNRPTWATFSTSTGRLSGTPGASNVGTTTGIVISVSDGRTTTRLSAFNLTVNAAANGSPTISGTPPVSVNVGAAYDFVPTGSDPNGDTLTYTVQNLPGWATFVASTGRIHGTPSAANVGTYSNIIITVSDGTNAVSLSPFSITVNSVSLGSATLSWTPPTQNTDGSPIDALGGYRILYGTSAATLTQSVGVMNPSLSSYVVTNLSPATWYFAVVAISASGAESTPSGVASKTIL